MQRMPLFLLSVLSGPAAVAATVGPLHTDAAISGADAHATGRWVSDYGVTPGVIGPPPGVPGSPHVCPTVSFSTGTGGNWHAFDMMDGTPIPPGLAPFCIHDSGVPTSAPPSPMVGEPDSLAAVAMMSLAREEIARANQELSLHQTGAAPAWSGTGSHRPEVVIIDSSPTSSTLPTPVPWSDAHGLNMAFLAESLLCDATTGICGADIRTEQAFFYEVSGTPPMVSEVSGEGEIGSLIDVAVAIRRAVHAWDGSAHPLILNLSVGWLERYGLTGTSNHAVKAALLDARCRGALVFAAAGNDSFGPTDRTGATFPAAFGRAGYDFSASDCAAATGIPQSWTGSRPLLIPVSGVDHHNADLGNTRADSRTRLVGYGRNVMIPMAGEYSVAMYGSSAASVVVASAAAALLHADPNLPWEFVPGELATHGMMTGTAPSSSWRVFHPATMSTRVAPQAAVHNYCTARACAYYSSPTLGWPSPPTPVDTSPSGPLAGLMAIPGFGSYDEDRFTGTCGATHWALTASGSTYQDDACPEEQFYGGMALPLASGQHPIIVCEICDIDPTEKKFYGMFENDVLAGNEINLTLSFASATHHPSATVKHTVASDASEFQLDISNEMAIIQSKYPGVMLYKASLFVTDGTDDSNTVPVGISP